MHDGDHLDLPVEQTIDDNVWQVPKHELMSAVNAARPSRAWENAKLGYGPEDCLDYLPGCSLAVLAYVISDSREVGVRRRVEMELVQACELNDRKSASKGTIVSPLAMRRLTSLTCSSFSW